MGRKSTEFRKKTPRETRRFCAFGDANVLKKRSLVMRYACSLNPGRCYVCVAPLARNAAVPAALGEPPLAPTTLSLCSALLPVKQLLTRDPRPSTRDLYRPLSVFNRFQCRCRLINHLC
jgi:hypothetical protein